MTVERSHSQVTDLLTLLEKTKELIAQSYYQGRIEKTAENQGKIGLLRSRRLMSPDIRDMFSLHSSLRHFLNTVLATERLIRPGSDFRFMFESLVEAAELYVLAQAENRQSDCDRYEFEVRDAICAIADAMDSELLDLRTRVANRFAAVSTLAEKKKQNIFYQRRTRVIVDLLEDLHFSDLGDRLSVSEDLSESFHSLWLQRVPAFRESLLDILETLQQYLFEFRQIEAQAKRLRTFALHLTRTPDWTPRDWDQLADVPEWLAIAEGILLAAAPDVHAAETEQILVEIAQKIPSAFAGRTREVRQPAKLVPEGRKAPVVVQEAHYRSEMRRFLASANSAEPVSALGIWSESIVLQESVPADVWLVCLLGYLDGQKPAPRFRLLPDVSGNQERYGNRMIADIVVGGAHG